MQLGVGIGHPTHSTPIADQTRSKEHARNMNPMNVRPRLVLLVLLLAPVGCESVRSRSSDWAGTIDTLPSGQVATTNTAEPIWGTGSEWQVVEELRIGSIDDVGPELFGRIISLEVDPAGRIYVFESQSQELRMFDAEGAHVRTVGRKGGGPGEFARAVMIRLAPDGNIWVVDPENDRISVFDTTGTYLSGRRTPGGFIVLPWPGGFDDAGYYYTPVFIPTEGAAEQPFRMGLERHGPDMQLVDTIMPPREPDLGETSFTVSDENRFVGARIPFAPAFRWHLHPSGTLWALHGGEYKLFQLDLTGDTLRTITREFEPYPVTDEELEAAIEDLDWFIQEGGKVTRGKIPSSKPSAEDFFFDDDGNVWVVRITTGEDEWKVLDVFDRDGRYLGEVRLPFRLSRPYPVIRGSTIWAVVVDEFEVQFVVRARIVKPEEASPST